MIDIDGLTGEQSLPLLEQCADEMRKRPADFIKLNPENGWGSYDTFLEAIDRLIVFAKNYPKCIWKASR